MKKRVYIYSESLNSITASGIEFSDLIEALKLKNIILLKHDFPGEAGWCKKNFEICQIDEIKNYKSEFIASFGDFSFIDLPEPNYVDSLEDQEIAEILYFGHMNKPFNSISIKNLRNNFMIIMHDNDYFLNLYFQSAADSLINYVKETMQVEFDNSLLKSKYLLISKNKVEVFENDIGIEDARGNFL